MELTNDLRMQYIDEVMTEYNRRAVAIGMLMNKNDCSGITMPMHPIADYVFKHNRIEDIAPVVLMDVVYTNIYYHLGKIMSYNSKAIFQFMSVDGSYVFCNLVTGKSVKILQTINGYTFSYFERGGAQTRGHNIAMNTIREFTKALDEVDNIKICKNSTDPRRLAMLFDLHEFKLPEKNPITIEVAKVFKFILG